jgi:hypothetical protein
MKIECVIVCWNYSDFLEHTLPQNLNHLDRIVVVTHPHDGKTKNLCAKYGVDCIPTEVFHHEGDKFNKGRAINLGLSHLKHVDWLLHIDADILLPHRFRDLLNRAPLEQKCLYGADRLNSHCWEHWEANKHLTVPQYQWRYLVQPHSEFELGARLLHAEYGYCPIGYFQFWHSSVGLRYPIVNGSAEHSDVMFAVQWARRNRHLLPEFFVYHLESEKSGMGKNWDGRKSKPFCPADPPPGYQPRRETK